MIIEFDENIISYEEIIRHFFSFHKPEQLDGIDPNIGSSYRSHIYTFNSEQKKIAEKMLNEINQKLNKKVVTKISDDTQMAYSKAEEYHQKYYLKKPQ